MYNTYLPSSKHPLNTKPLLTTTPITESPMTSLIKSFLNGSKLRYILLILFSPLIIPIVFVSFPFICAAEFCYRRREKAAAAPEMAAAPPVVVVKRDGDVAVSLLERYLEDQLGLAIEILDECGGDLSGGGYYGYSSLDDHHFDFDTRTNNC